jgi:hypothetical protein
MQLAMEVRDVILRHGDTLINLPENASPPGAVGSVKSILTASNSSGTWSRTLDVRR